MLHHPLPVALSCLAGLALAACSDGVGPNISHQDCGGSPTAIGAVQGSDFNSPMLGSTVTVRGIVTRLEAGGLYIESTEPDADPRTAEGLFLAVAPPAGIEPGMPVQASGTVAELGEVRDTLTALGEVSGLRACGEARPLPLGQMSLPLALGRREALEAMRIELRQPLRVTDVYRLSEGQVVVSADGILASPTEVGRPGDDARELARANRERSLYVNLPLPMTAIPVDTQLVALAGVLGNTGRGPVLLAEEAPGLDLPRAQAIPAPEAGGIRVMSLNLHNYFNGDGLGGGFPTPRGAESPQEFERQRQRIIAIVREADPHLLAVMELENDGFGPDSALADLHRDVEAATGDAWLAVVPRGERIGSDAITTGLLFRPGHLQATGEPRLLDAAPFDLLSRTPLAQRFADPSGGATFWVVVNHFKSKGSCPEQGRDRDLGDGQGCWNQARTLAAKALADWALGLAGDADGRVLLLGDFNAYRMEDPVQHLLSNGFEDLTAPAGTLLEYSYVYQGQAGTLDHAFATRELASTVRRSQILHVNAGWPPRMELPQPWLGASDHDPVVVDLRFRR